MPLAFLENWIEAEPDKRLRDFRIAVATVLHAIGGDEFLKGQMVLKGGILLALQYQGDRHTRDIDFSTSDHYADFDLEAFRAKLESAMAMAVESLDYGLDCRIQSMKSKPNRADATFPTLTISIGYAPKADRKKHRRLLSLNAIETVTIDFSFNEITAQVERIDFPGGISLRAYGLPDLIAEKYRAILQQEVRNRFRRQDTYDLFYLLRKFPAETEKNREMILDAFLKKSASRNLAFNRYSMRNEEIIRRSKEDYPMLAQEIEGELPDFEEAYALVQTFFENLPWPN